MECSKNIIRGELIHGKDLKDTPLFKITYSDETHHGFEYRDGENVDTLQFNDDVNVTCGPGGLYFTDITSLFWFAYDMGEHNLSGHNLNIRRVTLDDGEPVVKVYDGMQYTKYRAHKIHLGPKVRLYDMATINNLVSICPKLLEDDNTLFTIQVALSNEVDVMIEFVNTYKDPYDHIINYGLYDLMSAHNDADAICKYITAFNLPTSAPLEHCDDMLCHYSLAAYVYDRKDDVIDIIRDCMTSDNNKHIMSGIFDAMAYNYKNSHGPTFILLILNYLPDDLREAVLDRFEQYVEVLHGIRSSIILRDSYHRLLSDELDPEYFSSALIDTIEHRKSKMTVPSIFGQKPKTN